MAMSNQECIEYLEGFDRLKNMDPKMRKIIIDRAIKGIKSLNQQQRISSTIRRRRKRSSRSSISLGLWRTGTTLSLQKRSMPIWFLVNLVSLCPKRFSLKIFC